MAGSEAERVSNQFSKLLPESHFKGTERDERRILTMLSMYRKVIFCIYLLCNFIFITIFYMNTNYCISPMTTLHACVECVLVYLYVYLCLYVCICDCVCMVGMCVFVYICICMPLCVSLSMFVCVHCLLL